MSFKRGWITIHNIVYLHLMAPQMHSSLILCTTVGVLIPISGRPDKTRRGDERLRRECTVDVMGI